MPKTKATEVMRVAIPIGAQKLRALLETLDVSADATVRHYNGQLWVEEPDPHLPGPVDTGGS